MTAKCGQVYWFAVAGDRIVYTEAMPEDTERRKKLVVIDGKSIFYRGYYAMPNLATEDGTPTGGVYGFAVLALEVIKKLKPDYVAVAWDKPKTNIRKRLELYPAYKAGRKPAPPDFYEQIPLLHELLQAFGWPLYELDDYEADDIMGALAVQASKQGIETLLITSDLDLLQVVNGKTKVFALKRGFSDIHLYSPVTFEAKYGIKVEQFLDYKSLVGDSSDNIPGVPGVGPVAARQLLNQYKTLDGIYENIELINEPLRKKLLAGKESAYLSKKLASIWTDAPVTLKLDEVDGSKVQADKVLELLRRLQFKSLVRQLPEVMQVAITNHLAANGGTHLHPGQVIHVNNEAILGQVHLAGSRSLYMHSYAAGPHGRRPKLLLLSEDGDMTYVLHLDSLPVDAIRETLKSILNDAGIIGYDVKSTMKVLLELGVSLPPVHHDVLVAAFLLNALRREQSLTELAQADLGYEGSPFDNSDSDETASRAAEIIAVIKELHARQAAELQKVPKLPELASGIEWPVIPVLARMEYIGIELNKRYLQEFSKEIDGLIKKYEQQIYEQAQYEFNIGSPSQLADVLFTKLNLPTQSIKKGKTGYSTAASELDKLRGVHPIIDLITQYREVAKLKNTYVDTLPQLADDHSRVHTTFNLTIAQTGRLSSTDPNLQNIPVRTDLGRRIRTAFVAGHGKKLISADYSQFELRIAAVMADDRELIELFNRGTDIHAATAAQVYGRELEDVTKTMRRAAKVINFGILYGMSPHGLSVAAGMTYEQAINFIERYKELRKPLFAYMDRIKAFAQEAGYVETMFGRRRPMPDIKSSNFAVRQAAERAAINMPIQGTEADLMKMAMTAVESKLREQHNECNLLLQIHDSVLVECPEEVADRVAALLKETMESIYDLPVRLDVEVTVGDNWGEL